MNFGVFALFEDKALDDAFSTALRLAMCVVESGELMAFPKVSKAYFTFMEITFRNHIAVMLALPSGVFLRVVQSLQEGLDSVDGPLLQLCAAAVDHLATYYFRNMSKAKMLASAPMRALTAHFTAMPTMLADTLMVLFNILIFGESNNHWCISRPILSITLCSEQSFADFKQRIVSTQSPENQRLLEDAFHNLLLDIAKNLDPSNRDKFTQKITSFRQNVRGFLTRGGGGGGT